MEFEWNPDKDRANQRQHGVSFRDAISIWEGMHLEIEEIFFKKIQEQL